MLPPKDDRYIRMLAIDLEPSIAGTWIKRFFKMPIITMDVTTTDCGTERWRFIPPAAHAGFIIAPSLTTTEDAVALFSSLEHSTPLPHNDTQAIKFHINPRFAWVYQNHVKVRWWDVELLHNNTD